VPSKDLVSISLNISSELQFVEPQKVFVHQSVNGMTMGNDGPIIISEASNFQAC
jgi:hypothetical protein